MILTVPLVFGQEKQAPSATDRPQGPALDKEKAESTRKEFENQFKALLASDSIDEASEFAKRHENNFSSRQYIWVHGELADQLLIRGRTIEALAIATRAADHVDGPRARSNWIPALATRALCYQQLGLLDKAHADIQLALKELIKYEKKIAANPSLNLPYDEKLIFKVQLCETDIFSSRDDYSGMPDRVKRALQHPFHATGVDGGGIAARLRGRLAMVFSEQSRLDSSFVRLAREQFGLALACSALTPDARVQFQLGFSELEWRQGDQILSMDLLRTAEDVIEDRPDPSSHPMFQTLRALKARQKFERKHNPASAHELEVERDELAEAIQASTKEFSERALRPGGYGFLQYADRLEVLFELMRYEMKLDPTEAGRARALDHLLAIGEATTLGRRLEAKGASVERVRSELLRDDSAHGMLAYLPGLTASHVFLVTKEAIVHAATEKEEAIEEARVRAFDVLALSTATGAAVTDVERAEALRALASMLFPPAIREGLAKCSRVTILGRDLLSETPFEVLELAPGKEFGMTHAVTHAPSASVAIMLAKRAREELPRKASDRGAFTLLALPKDAGLKTKPEKLAPILDAYPNAGRSAKFGDEFDHEATKVAVENSVCVQIYSHGKREAARERSTVFVAQGSLEGAAELEVMNISPLMILATCGGALTPSRLGDGGSADLAGACFSGGKRARCVIQCAVGLDALAAVEITTHLARGLVDGLDVAEAMRRAREEMAKSANYSHPFHRMLFVVGAGHAPVFSR